MRVSPNVSICSGIAMTGTVSTGSQAIAVHSLSGYAIQVVMTSSVAGVTGTLKLQASLDLAPKLNVPNYSLDNWSDVSGSTVPIQFLGSSSTLYNVSDVYYPHVRLVYTNTAGSGSISARFAGKGA